MLSVVRIPTRVENAPQPRLIFLAHCVGLNLVSFILCFIIIFISCSLFEIFFRVQRPERNLLVVATPPPGGMLINHEIRG